MLITPAYLGAIGEGGNSWLNGPSLRNWGMEFNVGYRKSLACGLGLDISANVDSSVTRLLICRRLLPELMPTHLEKTWYSLACLMVLQ